MFTSLLFVKIKYAFLCSNISASVHGAILTQVVTKIRETFLMLNIKSCNRLSVFSPSLPSRLQWAATGQQGSLHSLFLFPMHIPLWDLTLKRHRAWENGAAEVFHQADSHFIIYSAWQLTSEHTHTHTDPGFQAAMGMAEKDLDPDIMTTGKIHVTVIHFYVIL